MKTNIKILSILLSFIMVICSGITAYAGEYQKNEFTVTTSDMKRPAMLKKGNSFKIKGIIKANRKITKFEINITDKNSFKKELKYNKSYSSKKLKLDDFSDKINFSKLSSGVKEFNILLYDEENNKIKISREFTVLGKAKEPVHITNKCNIKVSKDSVSNVTDSSDNTYWSSGTMTITFPKNKTADGIFIKWHKASTNDYTIKTYDANGDILDEYDNNCFNMLHKYYEVDENAVKAVIKLKKVEGNNGICCLRVYEKDRVGVSVERWNAPVKDECDLMVVTAHRDDELLFFGGTIPYYNSVRDKNVYTVYMSGRDRLRIREALAGQWSMGVESYPIFMDFSGGYHNGISGTLNDWGGENYVLERLVEKIRMYKPDVIVTHDTNGEYGHPTHKTTSYIVKRAIEASKDKNKFPDSYKKYGVWEVKKLYIHLYNKNKITMDWKQASSKLDGKTPYQLATIAYDKHISQHGAWSMSCDKVKKYPNTNFGLAYSTVGNDKNKNDFFENID